MAEIRPTLHVAGCGRAARTLARLWAESGTLAIGQIMNRDPASARRAARFIGGGEPVEHFDDRITRGWLMVGLPESALEAFVTGLRARMPGEPELCFHLSGAIGARVLEPLGCPFAAVHPVRPFARPDHALAEFPGTWCVGEGTAVALDRVLPAFEAIGGRTVRFEARSKPLYHASTVAAANFLVAVHRLALELAKTAGLEEAAARQLLCDLQAASLENIRVLGPADALTGPIERGDLEACRRLLEAVARHAPAYLDEFTALARASLDLARTRRPGDPAWRQLAALFGD